MGNKEGKVSNNDSMDVGETNEKQRQKEGGKERKKEINFAFALYMIINGEIIT